MSSTNNKDSKEKFKKMKQLGEKISMLTAYDYPIAFFLDKAGIDIILLGDSMANVVFGYESTKEISFEDMLSHAKSIRRAVKNAYLIADMPYVSMFTTKEKSCEHAKRFIQEAGFDAVKVEVTKETKPNLCAIMEKGIDVMGHIGLTPQTVSMLDKSKVQGKTAQSSSHIIDLAEELEKLGCFSVLLECVTDRVAGIITNKLKIPVIGCGSGVFCDGQVLVTYDLIGLYPKPIPKFVKQYANLSETILNAAKNYADDVRKKQFPKDENTFHIIDEEFKKIVH